MYQPPTFTAEEEWEFGELNFQRTREEQLEYLKNGVPMTARHKLWLQEQERSRITGQSYAPSPQNRALASPQEYASGLQTLPGTPAAGVNPISASYGASSSSSGSSYGPRNSPPAERETQLYASPSKAAFINQGSFRCDIQMHGKSGWKPLKAILDTGAEENWISRKIVDRLGLTVKNGLTTRGTTFDGRQIKSGSAVEPTWCVENSSNTHQTIFQVAPKEAPFEVLIGCNLIESGEVQFFGGNNPIQVLASSKITKEEEKQIERNEAIMKDKQVKLSSQTQEVKRNKTEKPKDTKKRRDRK